MNAKKSHLGRCGTGDGGHDSEWIARRRVGRVALVGLHSEICRCGKNNDFRLI